MVPSLGRERGASNSPAVFGWNLHPQAAHPQKKTDLQTP